MPEIRLTSIHIYPMKAARAVDLGESKVEPWGLADDRRWMLAGQDGRFISQREEPALARVSVIYRPNEAAVTISAPGFPRCRVAVPADTKLLKVSVWPCGRCVVTTTDQVTGERGKQPLKMLGRRRRFGKELVFGQNMIPDASGLIRVGDPVQILEAA